MQITSDNTRFSHVITLLSLVLSKMTIILMNNIHQLIKILTDESDVLGHRHANSYSRITSLLKTKIMREKRMSSTSHLLRK
jgi:hypothetical protein